MEKEDHMPSDIKKLEEWLRAGSAPLMHRWADDLATLVSENERLRAALKDATEDRDGWRKTASDLFDGRMRLRAEVNAAAGCTVYELTERKVIPPKEPDPWALSDFS